METERQGENDDETSREGRGGEQREIERRRERERDEMVAERWVKAGRTEGRQEERKGGTQNERKTTADGPPFRQSVVFHQID